MNANETIPTHSNRRIAVNTVVIYLRLVFTLGISLYSSRFVLEALGETDFGLYNVIAGVVAMFAFISATMATTTQRFVSFSMGVDRNPASLKRVVGSAVSIHFLISLLVAAIVMVGGLWAIHHLLNIPAGKTPDAIYVLVCVCIGLVGTINSVPYEALLMSHENIVYVSVCQTINALLKFAAAFVLLVVDNDRLRLYAVLYAILPYLIGLLEAVYCLLKYPETTISRKDLKPGVVMKEFSRFAGWVIIGTACMTIRNQGLAILLNIFWGVLLNAANAIANQVNSTLTFFSTSITTSLRPQLVKSAGEGNMERMMTLVLAASKYPLLLIILASCPIIVAMPEILSLWLKEVPAYTVQFCRIMLISTIVGQAYMGLVNGLEAIGKVKNMHIFCGASYLAVLPGGYLLGRLGYNPESLYWCMVFFQAVIVVYLIFLAGCQIGLDKMKFIKDVILRSLILFALLFIANRIIWNAIGPGVGQLVLLIIADIVIFAVLSLLVGLTANERKTVLSVASRYLKRIKK